MAQWFRCWLMACCLFLVSAIAVCAAPLLVNYQGTLYTETGAPVSGPVEVAFGIYDAEIDGTALWVETQTVQVQGGVFSVLLGSESPLDANLFANDSLWLELAIDSQPLTPRQRLASVPFALRAATATVAAIAQSVPAGSITSAMLAPGVSPGAPFSEGDFVNCYSGLLATRNIGECRPGARTWQGGQFGNCDGEVLPTIEICDHKDNDCNGQVDDTTDAPLWYRDADNDTFGNQTVSLKACYQPEGYASRALDCNDNQSKANPFQWEICFDGIDNDCNGSTDGAGCFPPGNCGSLGFSEIFNILAGCEAGPEMSCLENPQDYQCIMCLAENGAGFDCLNSLQLLAECSAVECGNPNLADADQSCLAEKCWGAYVEALGPPPKQCFTGDTRVCGSSVGTCTQGVESCNTNGYWSGVCAGSVGPVLEVCDDGLDNNCNGVVDDAGLCVDEDGDGFRAVVDCNDSDPEINPGAPESCGDGIDRNCDGDPAGPECIGQPCNTPCMLGGQIGENDMCQGGEPTNCDDGNPCTEDFCNDETGGCVHEGSGCFNDGDGDGILDFQDNCPATWNSDQADADQDGSGDACDCAPGDPQIRPGMAEICDDGKDNNCDGTVDNCAQGGACSPLSLVEAYTQIFPVCQDQCGYYFSDNGCPECMQAETGLTQPCIDALIPLDTCLMDQNCYDYSVLEEFMNCVAMNCNTQYLAAFGLDVPSQCTPGTTRSCGSDVGTCQPGLETCDDNGQWIGVCEGAVLPGDEICGDYLDNNCDGQVDEECGFPDNDGDGYPQGVDCNDENPEMFPGAPELCDGNDNDCDGEIDGNVADPVIGTACDGGDADQCQEGTIVCESGQIICTDFTDDNTEICGDLADNDCNGFTDEGCGNDIDTDGDGTPDYIDPDDDNDFVNDADDPQPFNNFVCSDIDGDGCDDCSLTGFQTVINDGPDSDGDGYCVAGDCNDADGTVHPGAGEFCGDLKDNNCDGQIDETCVECGDGICSGQETFLDCPQDCPTPP